MSRSKKHVTDTPGPAPGRANSRSKAGPWFLLVGIAAGAGLLIALAAYTGPSEADFQRLTGKWRRQGEKYVIEIRSVAPDGQVEAAYFNPGPIHVAEARATRQDGAIHVSVKMRDTGYEGSTYELRFDSEGDKLRGTYFPSGSEPFDVIFEREKEGPSP
jgi:hypothetical protein